MIKVLNLFKQIYLQLKPINLFKKELLFQDLGKILIEYFLLMLLKRKNLFNNNNNNNL